IFVISFERPFVSHREIDHVQHVVRTGVRLVCSNNYSNKRSKVPDGGLYDGLPKTWENFHYDGVAKSWEIFYDETFHTINFSVNQDRFENNFRRGKLVDTSLRSGVQFIYSIRTGEVARG